MNDSKEQALEARAAHRQVEEARLAAHRRVGVELLSAPSSQVRCRIAAANRDVDRWEARGLCSRDYIDRWRQWLALPTPELVKVMCSDARGWGKAMRQNSPFLALTPALSRRERE